MGLGCGTGVFLEPQFFLVFALACAKRRELAMWPYESYISQAGTNTQLRRHLSQSAPQRRGSMLT